VTGLAFLPIPISVFVSSQFTSRVLMVRLPQKAVMVLGATVASVGLLLATGIHADSSYLRIVVSLVLMGAGSGSTFVTLTSASLADVAPDVAGAASGLVNVSQQLGAAVGLAVLVTIFNAGAGHARLGPVAGPDQTQALHSLHAVFVASALFALAALVTIVAGVRRSPGPALQTDWDDDVVLDEAQNDHIGAAVLATDVRDAAHPFAGLELCPAAEA
jgi:MFS family permease